MTQAAGRRRAVFVAAWVLWAGGLAGCTGDANPAPPSTEPTTAARSVVVDTDLASDDLVALALLLSSSEVKVIGITVSGTGEVRCPRGAEVAPFPPRDRSWGGARGMRPGDPSRRRSCLPERVA